MLRVQRKKMLEQKGSKRSELGERRGSVYIDALREWPQELCQMWKELDLGFCLERLICSDGE